MSSIKEAKQQAARLLNRLNELGVAIKHSQALEGVAAILNHSDWNRYSALLKIQENSVGDAAGTPGENESTASLADTPLTFLAMQAGYGKSTILYHCLADALYQPSATGIYVDCSGHRATGIPFEIPRKIANHCSLIQLRVGDNGELQTITESLDLSEGSLKRIVIYSVDFGGLGSGRENQELANSKALVSLVLDHILKLPESFLRELRYALVDEFNRIGFKASQRGLSLLSGCLPNTKIVVSSQTLPELTDLAFMPSAPFSFICNAQSINAFATRFSGLELHKMAPLYKKLSVYNADTFDRTIDLSDPSTFIKSIAMFTAYNLHRKQIGKSWQDPYDLPVTNNPQLAYFETCTNEIAMRAMSRISAKGMGFAV